MLRNNLSICEHCKSKKSGYSGQSACTKIFLGNSSYTTGVMRSSALPSKRPPTLHHQPRTFDGGASPTSIQPAVSAGNQPPLVRHVLMINAWAVALQQGRYTWRHDSVLSVIRHILHKFWELPATQSGIAIQPVHPLCPCWLHSPVAITPTPTPFITNSASSSQRLGILV